MTAAAAANWHRWYPGEPSPDFIAAEVVAPGAIADLVAGAFDFDALAVRRAADIAPLTDWSSLLCALACRRPLTPTEVALSVGLSTAGARRSLTSAAAGGALRRDGRRFVLNDDWRPAMTRLVAAELKLRDWQKGVLQAARYRRWADASWLILGATTVGQAEPNARQAGVGLARLGREGGWQRATAAKRARPTHNVERRWAEEQVLAQALRDGWRPELTARGATFAGVPAVVTG